jgi:hypothetical protein
MQPAGLLVKIGLARGGLMFSEVPARRSGQARVWAAGNGIAVVGGAAHQPPNSKGRTCKSYQLPVLQWSPTVQPSPLTTLKAYGKGDKSV